MKAGFCIFWGFMLGLVFEGRGSQIQPGCLRFAFWGVKPLLGRVRFR